jgi:hypothetical protein
MSLPPFWIEANIIRVIVMLLKGKKSQREAGSVLDLRVGL